MAELMHHFGAKASYFGPSLTSAYPTGQNSCQTSDSPCVASPVLVGGRTTPTDISHVRTITGKRFGTGYRGAASAKNPPADSLRPLGAYQFVSRLRPIGSPRRRSADDQQIGAD